MHLILNHKVPDDFVIATGYTRSIRQLCKVVFQNLNLDYKKYVKQQKKISKTRRTKIFAWRFFKSKKSFEMETRDFL